MASNAASTYPDQGMATVLAQGVLAVYAQDPSQLPPGYSLVASIYACERDFVIWFDAVLFGYAITNGVNNLVVLRGTDGSQSSEDITDIIAWGVNTPCVLPPGGSTSYGEVNYSLYGFFTQSENDSNGNKIPSLASSITSAVQSFTNPSLPLYFAAHSLGGPMATMGALNVVASNSYPTAPSLYTFASLHVGIQSFATQFVANIPAAYRFANMCDFVPSLVGIAADSKDYVHVGLPCLFVWQTWGDWGNHSMQNVYAPTIENFWTVITYAEPPYPTPLV